MVSPLYVVDDMLWVVCRAPVGLNKGDPFTNTFAFVDPSVLLYESIALLIRTAKNIFELNPEVDRTKLVLLAKQLARSGKRFVGEDIHHDRALYEGELNASHSNFVDFCMEMLVDNEARGYLMSKKKFLCTPESFVYSAKLIERVIKFCAHV